MPREKRVKEEKPKPDVPPHLTGFALTWHKRSGQWVKKIRGRQYRFGADPEAAWIDYLKRRDALEAGIEADSEEEDYMYTVRDLCNSFLADRQQKLNQSEIVASTFGAYREICNVIVAHCGDKVAKNMKPDDFASLRVVLSSSAVESTRIRLVSARSVFKHAYLNDKLPKPPRYGTSFGLPDKNAIRRARAKKTAPVFDAETIRRILDAANGWMKTAVLLGINCGLYSKDISNLKPEHLKGEFLEDHRSKTGTFRRCWLWPETRESITENRAPDDNEHGRLLLSTRGGLIHTRGERTKTDLVASNWRHIKRAIKLKGDAVGFKNLRHTFATEASQLGDDVAVKLAMGHLDDSITDNYRHRMNDDRLIRISQYVRQWLFDLS